MNWILGDKHEIYGKVVVMANLQRKKYRFFQKDNVTTMIPLELFEDLPNEYSKIINENFDKLK